VRIGAANLFTVAVRELKDDSVPLVDADAVKASPVSAQLFQPIRRRYPQVFDRCAGVQQIEFLLHPTPELAANPAGRLAVAPVVNIGSRRIPEAGDHKDSIPEYRYSCTLQDGEIRMPKADKLEPTASPISFAAPSTARLGMAILCWKFSKASPPRRHPLIP